MTDSASPHTPRPLELDRIQSSRPHAGELRLRMSGRWIDAHRTAGEDEALLVVNVEGRRHRFPASREQDNQEALPPGRWSASFTVPAWAEPREAGQAALWIGNAVIPVPPMHQSPLAETPRSGPSAPRSGPLAPRSGPLAELLRKENVSGLPAELEHRTADDPRSRRGPARRQPEPESLTSPERALPATLEELRSELDRLRVAVEDQRQKTLEQSAEAAALRERIAAAEASAEQRAAEAEALREELASANVVREAAVSEAAGLRSELERVGSELAVTSERADTEAGDLGEARRLLADARALAQELRPTSSDGKS